MAIFNKLIRPNTLRPLVNTHIQRRSFTPTSLALASCVSDAIIKDHRELENYFNKIYTSTDLTEQREYQNQFTWELARHSVSEEIVVYPALEKYLKDGVQMADKDRREHQAIKKQLKTFQNLTPSDFSFLPTLKNLMQDLIEHMKEEEYDDLPQLERVLSEAASEKMAASFEQTKVFVPTRAHPAAPDQPPFETAVGLMTAPVDHLADFLFRKWPGKPPVNPSASTKYGNGRAG